MKRYVEQESFKLGVKDCGSGGWCECSVQCSRSQGCNCKWVLLIQECKLSSKDRDMLPTKLHGRQNIVHQIFTSSVHL